MKTMLTLLAAACALALAACGDKPAATDDTAATTPAPVASEPAPAATPAPVEPAATAPASDKPAAVVADCATEIEGNDAMQFNVGSITVPASCTEFKITLKHSGQMPVAAMGHNVVIAAAADMQGIAADGIGAGVAADYIKAGDARVIAHSKLVGGGESTTISFPVSKLGGTGPYAFFCSFPGHDAMMKGTIAVG
jgi:azurin